MKKTIEIHGNKLTLTDIVIEWSICKFEFIDKCKKGDVIIHDNLSVLELAELFNKCAVGLDLTDKMTLHSISRLPNIFFMNWIWVKDNFNPDAICEDPVVKIKVFKKDYIIKTNNIDNMNIFKDNINEVILR